MFRKLISAFVSGAAFMLGVAALSFPIVAVYAFTQLTGPAGSNPVASPQNLGDYNSILLQAAPAGTGTPSLELGFNPVATSVVASSTGGSYTTTFLQFVQVQTYTTTTAAGGGKCQFTGASGCFTVLDPTGQLRWVPFF